METTCLMNHTELMSLDSQIGVDTEDDFIIGDCCIDVLEQISRDLDKDSRELCPYRLQLYKYGIATKRLPSVLLYLDTEENEFVPDKEEIFNMTLRLLARLTQPLELLTEFLGEVQNSNGMTNKTQTPGQTCHPSGLREKIQGMVEDIKDTCLKTTILKVIVQKLIEILQDNPSRKRLDDSLCEAVNSGFFLFRNLLYLVDHTSGSSAEQEKSNQLLRVLLASGVQNLILMCVSSPEQERFTLSLVQLLASIFSDASGDEGVSEGGSSASTSPMSSICEAEEDLTADDIQHSEDLRVFTRNLMEQGLPQMLYHVKTILLGGSNERKLSPVYYLWLLDFCLSKSLLCKLPFSTVRFQLSVYSVDFLVYLGVTSLEHMLLQQKKGTDFSKMALNLSLVIKGMTNFFSTLRFYSQTELTCEEKQYLFDVQCLLSQSRELRQLVLLLLRCHQPEVHGFGHLAALVGLNHSFLLTVEQLMDQCPTLTFFNMKEHVKSYATRQVFQRYTSLISEWSSSSDTTLEQVFTMVHHVTLDLGQIHLLLQLPFVQAISSLESSPRCHKLSKGSVNLMHFALEEFYNGVDRDPMTFFKAIDMHPPKVPLKCLIDKSMEDNDSEKATQQETTSAAMWSQSELEQLHDVCVQCEDEDSFLETVVMEMRNLGLDKGQADIMSQMVELDWFKDTDTEEEMNPKQKTEDVSHLTQSLVTIGYQQQLSWLQEVLLEMTYIKLGGLTLGKPAVEEPVTMNYLALNEDVPLVAYTEEQEEALTHPQFSQLLTTIGIQNRHDAIFPRIPQCWGVDQLIKTAESIQEVNYEKTKFCAADVSDYRTKHSEDVDKMQADHSSLMYEEETPHRPPAEIDSNMWMYYVKSSTRPAPNTDSKQEVTPSPWWKK